MNEQHCKFHWHICILPVTRRNNSYVYTCANVNQKNIFMKSIPPLTSILKYIVNLGFTGVCLFFLFLLPENIGCRYSLEPPQRGGSNVYPQSMF